MTSRHSPCRPGSRRTGPHVLLPFGPIIRVIRSSIVAGVMRPPPTTSAVSAERPRRRRRADATSSVQKRGCPAVVARLRDRLETDLELSILPPSTPRRPCRRGRSSVIEPCQAPPRQRTSAVNRPSRKRSNPRSPPPRRRADPRRAATRSATRSARSATGGRPAQGPVMRSPPPGWNRSLSPLTS